MVELERGVGGECKVDLSSNHQSGINTRSVVNLTSVIVQDLRGEQDNDLLTLIGFVGAAEQGT